MTKAPSGISGRQMAGLDHHPRKENPQNPR